MESILRHGAAISRPACRSRNPWATSRSCQQQMRQYSKNHLKRSPPPPRLPNLTSTPRPLKYAAPSKKPPPSSYPSASSSPSTLASIPRHRRKVLLLGGALLALPVLYVSFLVSSLINAKPRSDNVPDDTSYMYNRNADNFDRDVGAMETMIGITSLRKQLCSQARGHVLESAVGTGRNTTAYPLTGGRIKSVTMVDQSREMLDLARLKWPEQGNAWFIHALFRVKDLSSPEFARVARVAPPMKSGQATFDTVVQTMGLCSTGRPVQLLRNLGRMCEPVEGRVYLLEHGKSHYGWLNSLLDKAAPAHAERHGCWWNKDIGEIVRESGLEIEEEKRYHMGTTWWYVLKVPQDATKLWPEGKQDEVDGARVKVIGASPWWMFWQR
ncbi:hypothetical protein FH972_022014 [Carpinus fangiana]|uniref:Methyltransferase type 11 domain-containing protein n=1 Tax=Carpinus fangiana TaxID=176857 RepID=A0A5N6KRC9_9ROSI|nr:hypothetical protein FH972_022014 [Carpinus fangiana]